MKLTRRTILKGALAAPLAGYGLSAASSSIFAADGPTVVVGSKDFTEQFILGNMYLLILEDMGITTKDSTNLGGTQIAHQALVNGDISLYPEYTGTGLTDVLKLTLDSVTATPAAPASPVASPIVSGGSDISQLVYNTVKADYESKFKLTWLARSQFNNTQALAVTKDFSDKNGITTISQLAAYSDKLTISAPSDFPDRQDGQLGLEKVYGGSFQSIDVLPVAAGLKYQALQDGDANVVLAFGTDGQITGYGLVLLKDDKGLWPPYNVAPVVRDEILTAYPAIVDRFNALTPTLTDAIQSGLNWQVDGDDKKDPKDVAKAYLTENKFIKG